MIHQEKVKDMTKMAIRESHGGDKELSVGAFRRKDYVALQMIKSFVLGTICYVLIMVLVFCAKPELSDFLYTTSDIQRLVIGVGVGYVVFMVIFLIITFVWARRRHRRGEELVQSYRQELNRVARSYQDAEEE